MQTNHNARNKNRSTITTMLVISALLPLVPMGMGGGLALAVIVLIWLIRASEQDVRGRTMLMGLAVLSILLNGALLIGGLLN